MIGAVFSPVLSTNLIPGKTNRTGVIMAKGLKIGDKVTVNKNVPIEKDNPAFASGLEVVEMGRLGKVVKEGTGRSMLVDFDGVQVQISNQRLDLVSGGKQKKPGKRGRPKGSTNRARPAARTSASANAGADMVNYDSPQFAAKIANKLLMSGSVDANPETVVVEIHLADLPSGTQAEIKRLLQQKLSLGLEDSQPRKRGPKPGFKRNKTS